MSEADIEAQNLDEIELLNQRGGRTLSVVDLIDAGTISVEAAGFMMCSVAEGASIIMGAGPGGAGKSTLLATALSFLPPGERLITVSSHTIIARGLEHPPSGAECFLAHELGRGHFYGYIWGEEVRDFFHLIDADRRIACTLHADDATEAESILTKTPLSAPGHLVQRVGLLGFIRLLGDRRQPLRRMAYLYGPGLRLAFRWRESDDIHEQVSEPSAFGLREEDCRRAADFLAELVASGEREFGAVRERVRAFYHRGRRAASAMDGEA